MDIKRVGVIGGGIMGSGIAQVCASHGYEVTVVEVDDSRAQAAVSGIASRLDREVQRERLTRERHDEILGQLQAHADLGRVADCDLVIEAIVEDLPTKQDLFARLGAVCKPDAILATNTSSVSVSALAAASGRPQQVLGIHFFNPPTVLPLAEIISTGSTSAATVEAARAFCESIDRVIVFAKDRPGFIVNRLLIPFILDAIRLVDHGIASAQEVDDGFRAGANHTMGPIATADLIGLDTVAHIADTLFEELGESRYKTPPVVTRMIALGHLGRKSGKGFFDYAR
ncbi:MAG: 3-hydroxyacyl-CoA dehydrogenase family protein [Dehalococcoidia bacterium]